MPNGIAVTRMMPRNSKPENTCPIAGSGTEKPKLEKASPTFCTLTPPRPSPKRFEPQAITLPTERGTRPGGNHRGRFRAAEPARQDDGEAGEPDHRGHVELERGPHRDEGD